MKNFLSLLLIIPAISFSQVGVNTTTPNAMLDVQSTNNGVLIPIVALTSIIDGNGTVLLFIKFIVVVFKLNIFLITTCKNKLYTNGIFRSF